MANKRWKLDLDIDNKITAFYKEKFETFKSDMDDQLMEMFSELDWKARM